MDDAEYFGACPTCAGPLGAVGTEAVACTEQGHVFTLAVLTAERSDAIRRALWSAEKALGAQALGLSMMSEASGVNHQQTVERLREDAELVRGLARRWDSLAG